MPVRDMRGREVPVGKIDRRVRYDGIVESAPPDWLEPVGAATLRKADVADGRGECHVEVDGTFGGVRGPAFDAEAPRELRISVGLMTELAPDTDVTIGFADAPDPRKADNWCYLREPEDAGLQSDGYMNTSRMAFGEDGSETESGNLGIITHGSSVVEVRIRPFEDGASVLVGGDGRGDVFYEDDGCPFAFSERVYPQLFVVGDAGESRVSLSTAELALLHN